jgi:hypothetical protein
MTSAKFDFIVHRKTRRFGSNTWGAQGPGEYAMMPFNLFWRRALRSGRLAKPRRRICELRRRIRARPSAVGSRMSPAIGRVFQIPLLKWLETRLWLAKICIKIKGV